MKVSFVKGIQLGGACPVCGAIDKFKAFVNGAQCKSELHNEKDFIFVHRADLKVYQLLVIEKGTSIIFDFDLNHIGITFPNEDESVKLPFFDMDMQSISVQSIKELLTFV